MLILSIGLIDLLRNIRQFLDARDISPGWGWLATIACLFGIVFAIAAVVQVGRTLVPRRRPGLRSLFFFGVVAVRTRPRTRTARRSGARRERELFDSMAIAAWNLAGIAGDKFRHLRLAYSAALLFVDRLGVRPARALALAVALAYVAACARYAVPGADEDVLALDEVVDVDDAAAGRAPACPSQMSFVSQSVPRTVAEAYLPFVRKLPFALPQTWRTDFDGGFVLPRGRERPLVRSCSRRSSRR